MIACRGVFAETVAAFAQYVMKIGLLLFRHGSGRKQGFRFIDDLRRRGVAPKRDRGTDRVAPVRPQRVRTRVSVLGLHGVSDVFLHPSQFLPQRGFGREMFDALAHGLQRERERAGPAPALRQPQKQCRVDALPRRSDVLIERQRLGVMLQRVFGFGISALDLRMARRQYICAFQRGQRLGIATRAVQRHP